MRGETVFLCIGTELIFIPVVLLRKDLSRWSLSSMMADFVRLTFLKMFLGRKELLFLTVLVLMLTLKGEWGFMFPGFLWEVFMILELLDKESLEFFEFLTKLGEALLLREFQDVLGGGLLRKFGVLALWTSLFFFADLVMLLLLLENIESFTVKTFIWELLTEFDLFEIER